MMCERGIWVGRIWGKIEWCVNEESVVVVLGADLMNV